MQFYIDPGTGSMLFTVLIGLISAGVYALRSSIIKLRFLIGGGRVNESNDHRDSFVIFTDSKRYWNSFKPICDEFEKRGVDITYLTASEDDPALDNDYKHVTCSSAGEGNKAFAKLNMIKADIVLSTTPGLDVYQWKRSRDAAWYAHIFHGVADATMYRMFGLDYYDSILLGCEFQAEQIRELERIRNLPEKELHLGGLTYMDALWDRYQEAGAPPEHDTTVLLAPSWGASSIFNQYGDRIFDALLATGYHLIVRPHPQSFTSESDLIQRLMQKYPESQQLEWNRDNDNFEVLRRSDIMISDYSSVIYDFALIFNRPVIYTEPSYNKDPYDAWWLDEELWMFKTLPKVGRELGADSFDSLKELIDDCLTNPCFQEGRDIARREGWANQHEAATAIVDYLIDKQKQIVSAQENANGQ